MNEILKNLTNTLTLPDDEYLEQESEILEIFVEEVEEILEELNQLIPQWLNDHEQHEALIMIRRYFHTLKGSGRMIGAKSSGELAWTVESLLNQVISQSIALTTEMQRYVMAVIKIYQYKLLPDFQTIQPHQLNFKPLVLLGQRLQQQVSLEPALYDLLSLSDSLTSTEDVTCLEQQEHDQAYAQDVESTVVLTPQDTIIETDLESVMTQDQEMLTIFLEESQDNLIVMDQFLDEEEPSTDGYNAILRAIHTLRGSSAMVGLSTVRKVSEYVEKRLTHSNPLSFGKSSNHLRLFSDYVTFIRRNLIAVEQGNNQKINQLYQQFLTQWPLDYVESAEQKSLQSGIVSSLLDLNIELLLDTERQFESRIKQRDTGYLHQLIVQTQRLVEYEHTAATTIIGQYSQLMLYAYQKLLNDFTLYQQQQIKALFDVCHQQFMVLFDTLASGQGIELCQEKKDTLQALHDFAGDLDHSSVIEQTVSEVSITPQHHGETKQINMASIVDRLAKDKQQLQSKESNTTFDPDLLEIFLEEAEELQVEIEQHLQEWKQDQSHVSILNNLMRYLHTLKGGANMVQATNIGLISHELETIYQNIIAQVLPVSAGLMQVIQIIQDELADRLQTLRDQAIDYPATETIQILKNIEQVVEQSTITHRQTVKPAVDPVKVTLSSSHKAVEVAQSDIKIKAETAQTPTASTPITFNIHAPSTEKSVQVVQPKEVTSSSSEIDDIIEYEFLQEAALLLKSADELFTQWCDERTNRNVLLRLQRTAHSLKGAARLANRHEVSDIATQLEHTFEQFAVHQFTTNTYDELIRSTLRWFTPAIFKKQISDYLSLKQHFTTIRFTKDEIEHISAVQTTEDVQQALVGDGSEPPSMMGAWDHLEQHHQGNEMIRISTDVIEKMIDLSGENSINRSRIEMDLSHLSTTLVEMELTIKRLADQLRRMEGELETQILARHAGDEMRYEDFDPLEMDQYSSLNQLSKSLAESSSDLIDFKSTLADKIRETEGLLLQQSRIQNEIQESLMGTRLVPFAPMLPRLQRLIRQMSTSLNKPVEFITDQIEGEFDRNILEHLITPFEHMLRNAMDHGLETKEERARTIKPEVGRIELKIERQGSDIIVSLKDDGKGIDTRKIRRKAIERGLIKEGDQLERNELLQLIFHNGFSTAQQITQISGRGVGLDVVQSEIKALGGHLSVDSVYGEGTTFTIRVPTTVAISDALMVTHGDQQFAIPLTQIDRIVRLEPRLLENYFKSKAEHLSIDLQNYRLRYLSELINDQPMPRFTDMSMPLPVLLLKDSGGQRVALLVDQLIGSREQVVVKPIGEQFANIGMIAGATILGDGRVCLILDVVHIIRHIQSSNRLHNTDKPFEKPRQSNERRLIMIVDDSVTVRKVTSRLLERQGYDVITAKDGVDAIEKLETIRPDIMLLDIEMPRMDGFEVTTLVRRNELYQDLPIIMITSRTGEKHRERALSLGVTQYMGKPFQETELLTSIQNLLTTTVGE